MEEKIKSFISTIPTDSCFVSRFDDNSLFYRFSCGIVVFKLHVFLDYDIQDKSDIEAIVHIYKNKIKQCSRYGSLDYIFSVIKEQMS